MASRLPRVDEGTRDRLTARFGASVGPWFDKLPQMLANLAERWQLEFDAPIPRGSVSVVFRCRIRDGRRAILKASPDRARLRSEGSALDRWQTAHTPAVLALDDSIAALLIEAIEPGTPLDLSSKYPGLDAIIELLNALHAAAPDLSYPTVAQRVTNLFDSSLKLYQRHPDLTAVIPLELYKRGRLLANGLAQRDSASVLLHGDLTPANILDGGERGLVAIDPAPCLGDAAFDAVDLVLWQADDLDTIEQRAKRVAEATHVVAERLIGWCVAFAGMTALELASHGDRGPRSEMLRRLAARSSTV